VASTCAILAVAANGQAPNVGPTVRLDSGTSSIRWALEFSGVAHDHGVAVIWMKQPQEQSPFQRNTFGRAFSADCGTTWAVDNLHGSDGAEVDPQSAVDARTANFWVGGFASASGANPNRLFVTRREVGPLGWGSPVTVIEDVNEKNWMAAGRRPDVADTTRLYMTVAGDTVPLGLIWSDSLGDAASWSAPLDPDFTFSIPIPRVGTNGELYVAGTNPLSPNQARLARSFELVSNGGAPKFDYSANPISDIATGLPGFVNSEVPGSFRVVNLPIIAVDPLQSKRVYCAYVRAESTAGPDGNVDVDVYVRKTDDASDQTIDWGDEIRLEIEGDQFFPWIECDAHGRVHLLFMDSRNDADQDDSETVHAFFDVYYAYSLNQGQTWTHIRLTDEMFDVDAADDDPADEKPCDFFGDYLGMGRGRSPRVPRLRRDG
jgi:hypothetical protein